MNYIKKLTAISVILGILLTNSISFAENSAINGSTATTSGITAGVDTITITNATEFPDGDEIVSATITNLDGTAAGATTLVATGDNANDDTSVLTITTADLIDNTSYIISFNTVSGDFGTTTLRIGVPTNDTLTVTASVQPILKFGLESTSENLGALTTAFGAGVTTGIEVGTNAINGVTVTATSTNGGLTSATTNHTINKSTNDLLYANEGYQFTSILGVSDSSADASISGLIASNVDELNSTHTIYSADKPQNFDGSYDTNFTVQAKISESTPTASDYTDVIIFTATANF